MGSRTPAFPEETRRFGSESNSAESGALRGVRKLSRKIGDRLGVDFALVPLLDHAEIRAARFPAFAFLPAIRGEIIRRRGQHVGRAMQQIAAAIVVEINSELQIG